VGQHVQVNMAIVYHNQNAEAPGRGLWSAGADSLLLGAMGSELRRAHGGARGVLGGLEVVAGWADPPDGRLGSGAAHEGGDSYHPYVGDLAASIPVGAREEQRALVGTNVAEAILAVLLVPTVHPDDLAGMSGTPYRPVALFPQLRSDAEPREVLGVGVLVVDLGLTGGAVVGVLDPWPEEAEECYYYHEEKGASDRSHEGPFRWRLAEGATNGVGAESTVTLHILWQYVKS
jgi:hypothetical protein